LIYIAGTFFLYITAANMMHDKQFIIQYTIINSSFNILKNVLLGIAMLMKPNNSTNQNIFPEDRLSTDWNSNQTLHNLN
jgi:hypothetical protein